ncbi:helix-turn-helix transcriptional regulator [Streptomyces sp. NRRL F-5123]|uniref:helix-turn-helix transcriptional regulator n=1 Tax=Streptomyces sp. NRRL F-5123 TaxID=1463856 RepID=UPI000AF118E4|nr:helix-turn-helix transcriptional regulator [Streptomyces sp. NRRL F-5123]
MAEGVRQPDPVESSLLSRLGLDADQAALYLLLVDRPDSDPAALPPLAGEGRDVAGTLAALVDRGLASAQHHSEGTRYRATPPTLALGPLLESQRSALHGVELLVADLADRHRLARSDAPVEVLSGAVAIRRWLVTMQREARSSVRTMMPAMPVAVINYQDNLDEAERDMMRRGVRLRTVVQRAWLEDAAFARSLAEVVAEGQDISVADTVPTKLLIVDDDIGLIPVDPDLDDAGEPVALVVHRSGLLTALISLFEQCFANGWRLHPAGLGQVAADDALELGDLNAIDRKIIALLHVGLTDSAIARQLRLSHRTVQRRLHRIMEQVGVSSRFQLGWYVAGSGWLDPEGARPPACTGQAPCGRCGSRPDSGDDAPAPPG